MKMILPLLLPLVLFWGGCDRNSRIIGYWASDVNLTITSLKKLMADSSDIFEKEIGGSSKLVSISNLEGFYYRARIGRKIRYTCIS